MKRVLVTMACLLAFASCKQKERALEHQNLNLQGVNDSLQYILEQRDSIISDALFTISDISLSLDDIKQKEGVVIESVEIGKAPKVKIKEDLERISAMIEANKKKIASMERTAQDLYDANIKIDGLTKLIQQLKSQIESKDKTINEMLSNIDNLKQQIEQLNSQVDVLVDNNQNLASTLNEATDNLNTAYYIVGDEKMLLADSIILKKGLIGRTLTINPNLDKSKLKKIDIREIEKIDIKGSKVEILGSFPITSYKLTAGQGRGVVDELVIEDATKFWSSDRILVISYK